MNRTTKKQIALMEKDRNIGEEILEGLHDIKSRRIGRRNTIQSYPIIKAREKCELTQAQFAALLGVSVRTLQDWEQGRREPSGGKNVDQNRGIASKNSKRNSRLEYRFNPIA